MQSGVGRRAVADERERHVSSRSVTAHGSLAANEMASRLAASRVALLVPLSVLCACGGGGPLLHPARTLSRGDVRAVAGTSAQFATGELTAALTSAREQAASGAAVPGPPGTNASYARGAFVAAAVAPGLAPFVAARAGVGASFEGGLAYTGRGLRIDLRRSFPLASQWDLSLGAGASAPFYGGDDGSLRNVDLSKLRGYGADVPALVGYESPSSAYKAWFGARGGFDRVSLENVSTDPRPGVAEAVVLEADRLSLGAVVGGALGYRYLHVGLELQAGFISISGRYNETAAKVSGLAITPATALSWTF